MHVFITTIVSALRGSNVQLREWIALIIAFVGVVKFCSASAEEAQAEELAKTSHGYVMHEEDEADNILFGTLIVFTSATLYSMYNLVVASGKVSIHGGLFSNATVGLVYGLINSQSSTEWLWSQDI